MVQPSCDVPCSAKLKCHSAASLGALAGAAETSISQRRRPRRWAFGHDLAACLLPQSLKARCEAKCFIPVVVLHRKSETRQLCVFSHFVSLTYNLMVFIPKVWVNEGSLIG